MYTLRDIFTTVKMNITTEASKFMYEDRLGVRKGPNLKLHVNAHFKGLNFAEMTNRYGISIC